MEKYFGFAKELMDHGLATERSAFEENRIYDKTIDFVEDIPFYLALAKSSKSKVLDIGCGTGRIMGPMLESDVEIVGMDLSEDMLKIAREKLQPISREVVLLQGDMRDFEIPEQFSLILIPYYSMIYMYSDEDRKKVFQCVYKHLEPGGKFAFDFDAAVETPGVSKPWLSLQDLDGNTGEITLQTAQMKVTEENLRLMNILYYTHKKDETIITAESILEATCKADHMKALLEQEGFLVEGIYGGYDYRPYDNGEVCVVVAKKS